MHAPPLKTLVYLHRPHTGEILLAMKKRGFGEGKWNGVGGKIEEGETVEEAAVREAREEIDVAIDPSALDMRGAFNFSFEGKPEYTQSMHVFLVSRWGGEPTETDEMRPQWFPISSLPYQAMWASDAHWLPRVLGGKRVRGRFHFSTDGNEVLDMDVTD